MFHVQHLGHFPEWWRQQHRESAVGHPARGEPQQDYSHGRRVGLDDSTQINRQRPDTELNPRLDDPMKRPNMVGPPQMRPATGQHQPISI